MWLWILFAAVSVFFIVLYLLAPMFSPPKISLENAHVVITGGSSGIGKSMAAEALKQGAKVTIVARDKVKLEEARGELAASVTGGEQRVQVVSVDLSKDYEPVESAFKEAAASFGAVDILVNNAGTAIASAFDKTDPKDFRRLLDINYMSAVHATRAVLPSMKTQECGRVVFVSSQAGQIGLFGYTAYSASKFALKGLVEALQMEVKPYNIYLTLAFPPDTNTPGFQKENEVKPEETRLISETSGLFSSETVACTILSDMMRGRFYSSIGLDGFMLSCLTSGCSPVSNVMDALQQAVTMGLFRLVSLGYLIHFDGIVRNCKLQRDSVTNKKTS